MKRLLLSIYWLFPLLSIGQVTFRQAMADGMAQYKALDYEDALKKFEAAQILAMEKGNMAKQEVSQWIIRTQEARFNALSRQLAVSDSLRQVAELEKINANQARQKADSALRIANRVLDQMYFYEGKYGLTLKQVDYRHMKYGFIDRAGNEVLPFVFDEASPFASTDGGWAFATKGYAKVTKNGQQYLLDTLGNTLHFTDRFEDLHPMSGVLFHRGVLNDQQFRTICGHQRLVMVEIVPPTEKGRLLKRGKLTNLHEDIHHLGQLQTLKLVGNQIKSLPPSFSRLVSLRELRLSDNQLVALPASFGDLQKLEKLELHRNPISLLPETFGQLKHVSYIDLSSNQLVALPNSIGNLQNLRTLDLGGNLLQQLPPSFCQLRGLNALDLNGNQLKTLPPHFGALTNLWFLSLQGNQLSDLPTSVGKLVRLNTLILSNNRFFTTPQAIFQLTYLKTLDLSNNQLTDLPNEIRQLESLESLFLAGNRLTAMPRSISMLKKLKRLDLRGNPLSTYEKTWLRRSLPNCRITF